MFPAHQGHLYLLISAPKGCVLFVYFSAQRVHIELLISAPKECVLLLIFSAQKGAFGSAYYNPQRVCFVAYFLHKRVQVYSKYFSGSCLFI